MFGVIKEKKVLVGICNRDIMNVHVLLLVLDVYKYGKACRSQASLRLKLCMFITELWKSMFLFA